MAVRQIVTTTGAQPWVNLDWLAVPFNVAVGVDLVSPATATFTVQYTDDDLNDSTIQAITTFNDTVISAVSASSQNVVNRPTKFARLNVTALSLSTGALYFNVIQGSNTR